MLRCVSHGASRWLTQGRGAAGPAPGVPAAERHGGVHTRVPDHAGAELPDRPRRHRAHCRVCQLRAERHVCPRRAAGQERPGSPSPGISKRWVVDTNLGAWRRNWPLCSDTFFVPSKCIGFFPSALEVVAMILAVPHFGGCECLHAHNKVEARCVPNPRGRGCQAAVSWWYFVLLRVVVL